MVRRGSNNAQLVIERGRRHLCHYETGFGDMVIGVNGMDIENTLGSDGGELNFSYKLDLNSNFLSLNRLSVTVRRREAPAARASGPEIAAGEERKEAPCPGN